MDVAELLDKIADHRMQELSNFISLTRDKYDGWFGDEFSNDQAADLSIASSMIVYAVLILRQHGYDINQIKNQVPQMIENCAGLDPSQASPSSHHQS